MQQPKDDHRKELEKQVEAFLAKGGKIVTHKSKKNPVQNKVT